MKEITKSKYRDLLALSCKEFWNKTHKFSSDGGDYTYCVNEANDNDKARLSYLDYLINEKHYSFPESKEYIELKIYLDSNKTKQENINSAVQKIVNLSDEEFDLVLQFGELKIQC